MKNEMKTTIQIKSIFGKLLFEFEKEKNSVKETLQEAHKQSANLRNANLYGANLYGANLRGANLRGANLRGTDLYGADLYGANLRGANLRGTDLRGANLCNANLRNADLSDANLRNANLYGANLYGANLRNANLRGADLRNANLRGADLHDANLCGADLRNADLSDANLCGADLRNADLCGADLRGADLKKLITQTTILPQGDLIVWKKLCDNVLAKLLVPSKAKRVNAAGSRKCRFEYVQTLALYKDGKFLPKSYVGIGKYDSSTIYKVGEITKPDSFDPSPLIECSHGIHAFITREEAVEYN